MSESTASSATRTSQVLDLEGLGTVLSVWAHPDDETYLVGGLMARLRDAGKRVVCVTATRGESADPAATDDERAALGVLRTDELEAALRLLGVDEHHWLDLPDGGCSELDASAPVATLVALIDDVDPDTVITFGPDGFTGHPDHKAVSSWVFQAVQRTAHSPRILHPVKTEPLIDPELDNNLGVFDLGRPRICAEDELAVQLPLEGADLERKVAALARQVSQTADLIGMIGLERFAAWVSVESLAEPKQET